jgi:hypothetical protein
VWTVKPTEKANMIAHMIVHEVQEYTRHSRQRMAKYFNWEKVIKKYANMYNLSISGGIHMMKFDKVVQDIKTYWLAAHKTAKEVKFEYARYYPASKTIPLKSYGWNITRNVLRNRYMTLLKAVRSSGYSG